jgi:hypothetical protein
MAIAIDDSRRLLLSKDARPNFSSLSNLAKHAQQRKGTSSQPAHEQSTSRSAQGTVYGGSGQPMELDRVKGSRPKRVCSYCGRKGHTEQYCWTKKSAEKVRVVETQALPPQIIEARKNDERKKWKGKQVTRAVPARAMIEEEENQVAHVGGLLASLSDEQQDFLLADMASRRA